MQEEIECVFILSLTDKSMWLKAFLFNDNFSATLYILMMIVND
jgi:hypothetical protein